MEKEECLYSGLLLLVFINALHASWKDIARGPGNSVSEHIDELNLGSSSQFKTGQEGMLLMET